MFIIVCSQLSYFVIAEEGTEKIPGKAIVKRKCFDLSGNLFSKSLEEQRTIYHTKARSFTAKDDQELKVILLNDKYSYDDLNKWIPFILKNNDKKATLVKKDEKLALPFCENVLTTVSEESLMDKTNFMLISMLGSLKIGAQDSLDSELELNFYKLGIGSKTKINESQDLLLAVNLTRFHQFVYKSDLVDVEQDVPYTYYDFAVGMAQTMFGHNFSLMYNNQNYFFVSKQTEIKIQPNRVEKLSLSTAYPINESFAIPMGVSLFTPLSTTAKGQDLNIGINYSLNKFKLGLSYYRGMLETTNARENSNGIFTVLTYQL